MMGACRKWYMQCRRSPAPDGCFDRKQLRIRGQLRMGEAPEVCQQKFASVSPVVYLVATSARPPEENHYLFITKAPR